MAEGFTKLEEALVAEGVITADQLNIAKESQKNLGIPLEQILVSKKFVTEEQLLKILGKRMGAPFVSLAKYKVDADVVRLLPVSTAKKYKAVPIFKIENKVTVAISNPLNLEALDAIREILAAEIEPVLALEADINWAINEYYRGAVMMRGDGNEEVEVVPSDEDSLSNASVEELEKITSGGKVVSSVNKIMQQACEDRASDIHLEPSRDDLKIRFRIDGVMEELTSLPKTMHLPIISRIKIMGNMDVAERRVPQDGRVRVKISGKEVDMRIATYPTMFGEAAAIRLLKKEQLMTLEDLGFLEEDLKIFAGLISKPHGIFLVTGPTGSGKTTTLYSSLMNIKSEDKHILSIEDPVEHEIPGVDQQQVNTKAGLTFATSLRSMLRQDPDVIMVGEIRDQETADIAVRAAMTGHLVFSTLHTNTAVGAVTRLVDLGVAPYMVASTLIGVMAQRLVRKICPKCKIKVDIPSAELQKLGPKAGGLVGAFKGKGCKFCRNSGYIGRVGLFEIVPVNDEVRVVINKQLPEVRIKEKVVSMGLHSILEDGIEKIRRGMTTVDEVLRVTQED